MTYFHTIGPVQGNTQSITLRKGALGNGVTVVSTPKKVEEFVQAKKKAQVKDVLRGARNVTLGTLAGALAGLGLTMLGVAKKAGGTLVACCVMAGSVLGAIPAMVKKGNEKKLVENFLNENK